MRRFLKIVLILLVLLIVAALAVPFVVPADRIKSEVLAQIQARTGRDVTIDHVSASLFPTLGLNAEGVKIGNPKWINGGVLARIKTLSIGVELLPLLHGQVQLKNLTLEEPIIVLVKFQGKGNWEFDRASAPASPPAPAPGAAVKPAAAPGDQRSFLAGLHLDNIAITHGTVAYKDEGTEKAQTVSDLNLTLKAPDLSEKADIALDAVYEEKKANIALTVLKPLALMGKGTADISLKAGYGPLDFTWKGTASFVRGGTPFLTGAIDIPSLSTADFSRKETPQDKTAPPEEKPAAAQPPPAGGSHWSDAPIRLDGLKRAFADLTVSIGKLTLPKTVLENITAHVQLANGALLVRIDPVKAYGGTISLTATASAAGAFNALFSATGAQAEPLLHDFAGYDRLSGTIDLQTKLAASGDSQRAIIGALSGQGSVNFKNGKLKGVNMAALLKSPAAAQGQEGESTDFSEFSETYTIAQGVLSTHDLKLTSPLLRMSGEGTADLPGWQEHFLLKPMLVASQGGEGKEASGIIVPVAVDGPLDHPHYKPDLKAALQENLKDPAALKQNIKDLKKTFLNGGALQNLLR